MNILEKKFVEEFGREIYNEISEGFHHGECNDRIYYEDAEKLISELESRLTPCIL